MSTYLKAASLGSIAHGFSTSAGLDVAEILPGAPLVRLKQVHSSAVFAVTRADKALPEGSYTVTAQPRDTSAQTLQRGFMDWASPRSPNFPMAKDDELG